MASKYSLKTVFGALDDFRRIDEDTIRYSEHQIAQFTHVNFRWNGPHLGGPFMLKRLFGGTTFALSYLALKQFIPDITVEKMQLNLFRPGTFAFPSSD